jgi:hypothetical protein
VIKAKDNGRLGRISKSGFNRNARAFSGVTKGEANGQLPISFGGLPIVIFISKFLPIEIFLFQNCLFIFELDSKCIFFLPSESYMHCLFVLSVKN